MSDTARSRTPWVVGGLVVAALLAGVLVWLLSGSEPAPVDLRSDAASDGATDEAAEVPGSDPDTDGSESDGLESDGSESDGPESDGPETDEPGAEPPAADELEIDGMWLVDTDTVPFDGEVGAGSFVGYRVDEELSGIGATTAVGRTAASRVR